MLLVFPQGTPDRHQPQLPTRATLSAAKDLAASRVVILSAAKDLSQGAARCFAEFPPECNEWAQHDKVVPSCHVSRSCAREDDCGLSIRRPHRH